MKKLKQRLAALNKQHTAALQEAEKIQTLAADEGREITEEEQTSFDAIMADTDKMEAQMANVNKLIEKQSAVQPMELDEDEVEATATLAVRDRIEDDPKRGFTSFGDFACSLISAGKLVATGTGSVDPRLLVLGAATGLNQTVGSEGGFLVPPEFSNTIYEGVMADSQSLLNLTDNYTVTGESLTFNANAETSRVTGSRWGGIQAYWIKEADQMTASKPTLRQVTVEPEQLVVMVYATDKLLNNATAVEQWLTRASTDEIAFMVGDAIINGDGVGKPQGVMNSGCIIEVAKETSQSADTITAVNINKMWERLPAKSWGRAVWFINQDVMSQFDGLNIPSTDVGGTTTIGGFATKIYDGEKMAIKNRPILPIEYCQTLGDAGDIILADMSAYLVGLRNGIASASSMHLRFDYNETAFRFLFDCDGLSWLLSAITPKNGTNTLSPFVRLASR